MQVADKENGVKMDGYDFGGKTGTAQKLPRSEDKYVISLISAAPMSSPQLVLYVVVDEYEGNDEDGSIYQDVCGMQSRITSDFILS